MNHRTASFLLALFLYSTVALAQNSGNARTSYKLLSIHIKGLSHFKEEQIVAASGLSRGQMAGEDDFKQALQRLGDTGLFSNLTYSYRYTDAGCNLEFQVEESDKFVPAAFDNFVWFADQELIDLVHARVPLFEGKLPLSGSMPDRVSDALNAILAERKIPGQVEYLEDAPINGPIDSYVYKITFHAVTIRNSDFPGAAPAEVSALQAAAKQIAGKDYMRSAMREQEQFSLLPVYFSRGYLKAAFADSRPTIVQDGAQTLVDVSFPVTPGIQYKVADVEWAGNAMFPAAQLQPLLHLKTGEPANAVQLDDDLRAVQKLYGTKGYLAAHVQPKPTMDDAAATVRYQLNVAEGDQYHMGDLKIDGLAEETIGRLTKQWQMKKGDVFDESYVMRFFSTIFADAQLGRSYNVVPKQSVDGQSKTVTVYLHFVPKN